MFKVPEHSLYAMAAILALLVLSTIIVFMKTRRQPEKDHTELRQRVNSWWVMIGLVFFVLMTSRTVTVIFFAFLSFLALKEFFSIVPTRHVDRRVIFWVYLSIPVQYWFVESNRYGMFIIFIPVYIFLFVPMRMVLLGETKGFIKSAGVIHWAAMLTVFCVSHLAYLLMLPVGNQAAGNIGLVLFLLILTELNDVSQYVWGKSFGRRKIVPKVSPNKTWAGFLGGIATTTAVAALLGPYLTPLGLAYGTLAGVVISASGFIGDVVISSVKRDLGVKDWGSTIPGHGGILDRMDSLIYTAPLFLHYTRYILLNPL